LDDNRKLLRELKAGYRTTAAQDSGSRQGKIAGQAVLPWILQVGDRVRLRDMDVDAEVLNPPDEKGEVQVLAGRIRMSVSLSDLMPVDRARSSGRIGSRPVVEGFSRYSGIVREKIVNISGSIDLHGKNLDEAELIVDKYLDDAFLAGLPEVVIVHGRGAGILRSGLRRMLSGHRHVKKTRPGGPEEGGEGTTVVTIK
jgi:DNA mismatch repair protein MutS2